MNPVLHVTRAAVKMRFVVRRVRTLREMLPVLPSVRMHQRGSHCLDVRTFLYWRLADDNMRGKCPNLCKIRPKTSGT
jgi:hypothetical protein